MLAEVKEVKENEEIKEIESNETDGNENEVKANVLPDCCKPKNEGSDGSDGRKKGALNGLIYGLAPHAGCIAFIIASVLGVTVATEFFKPLLLNPYFFYGLIALSLAFATASAAWYLNSRGLLSLRGAKRKWKYLSVLYGSTVAVNLLLFMVVFPLAANYVSAQPVATQSGAWTACPLQQATASPLGASSVASNAALLQSQTVSAKLKLQVDIPCPGHAPLISGELKKIPGVRSVQFSFPNVFDVEYDSTQATQSAILGLEVFKTYKAAVVN